MHYEIRGRMKMRKMDILFIFGVIACFIAAYQGMVFSPSFTMIFVVVGMGFCIVGELLHMLQEAEVPQGIKKICGIVSGILCGIGMIWAFPAVIIYATGDDWMNGCMRAAGIVSVFLCGIWLGWKWKKGEIRPAVCGKAVELILSLAAAWLAVFCGLNSVALLPYGVGLLLLGLSRQLEGKKKTRKIVFFAGMVLIAVFPVALMI